MPKDVSVLYKGGEEKTLKVTIEAIIPISATLLKVIVHRRFLENPYRVASSADGCGRVKNLALMSLIMSQVDLSFFVCN
jgi:hypothetical protein